jgi:hypothetical protein
MNLSKRVIKQLEQLATKGPQQVDAVILNSAPSQGYIIGVPAEAQEPSAAITLEGYDRYSVTLRQLEVSYGNSPVDENKDEDYLRQCAERVARRLTYLEESLGLLELNAADNWAQLRSDPPQQENETLTYWEVLIWTEPCPRARLTRYCWTPGSSGREAVAYPATFATLGRIANDLALSLAEEVK